MALAGPFTFEKIPEELKTLKRFLLWRYEAPRRAGAKQTKVPYTPAGRRAATNKPATWSPYTAVIEAMYARPDFFTGIGIVLGDGIMGIDIDDCVDDGDVMASALEIIEEVPGYVELSPSGSGIHIITRASLPADRGQIKFKGIEFYDETSPRYLTLTGNVWCERDKVGTVDVSDAVAYMYRKIAAQKQDANDDETLLKKIRKSKQGEKFSTLFDRGDTSGFKSDSEAVASLLITLSIWTKKNPERMDRLFRLSALYKPEKWDRRQNGTTLGALEIRNTLEFCKKNSIGEMRGGDINFSDIDDRGVPLSSLANFQTLLEHHKISIRYNEIKKTVPILFDGANDFIVDQRDNASLGVLISHMRTARLPVTDLTHYICTTATMNHYNPVKEWICSVPWDGIDRIEALAETLTAASYFPLGLKYKLIRRWLLSAVAAACHNQNDFMARGILTLVGRQALGKTRWIKKLAPEDWLLDGAMVDPTISDSVRNAISHWIVELGELESSLRRDIGRLKAFMTYSFDHFRIPYATNPSMYPRRTVFAASVNLNEFLVDPTGNTRFWTIPVSSINYNHVIDMQQVYAQLYVDWANGKKWWFEDAENAEIQAANEMFEERDEVFDILTDRVDWSRINEDIKGGRVDWMTPTDVLISICKIERPTKGQRNSCARVLRSLTKLEHGKRGHSGGRTFPVPRRRPA